LDMRVNLIKKEHKSVQLHSVVPLALYFCPCAPPIWLASVTQFGEAGFGSTLALLAIASYLPPPGANISIVTPSYLQCIVVSKLSMSRLCNVAPKNCKCASYTSEQNVKEL